MRLTWLCALWRGFLLPGGVVLYLHFFFPFPPSVSLLQAGTEEDVVYPGKLPIVSGGNSLWEGAPRERGSATRGKLTTDASGEASARPPCIRRDLMPGVSWPSPGTGGDVGIEATKGNNGETRRKLRKEGKTMVESRRQTEKLDLNKNG